jgi:hypothetical protein
VKTALTVERGMSLLAGGGTAAEDESRVDD